MIRLAISASTGAWAIGLLPQNEIRLITFLVTSECMKNLSTSFYDLMSLGADSVAWSRSAAPIYPRCDDVPRSCNQALLVSER